ncbi:MAG: hypothetical protein PHU62_09950, partial [Bacteroidales bacterium]|nr:hypothetical protein [Bacteroidales bacterium]
MSGANVSKGLEKTSEGKNEATIYNFAQRTFNLCILFCIKTKLTQRQSISATGMLNQIPISPIRVGRNNKSGIVKITERHKAITADSTGRSIAV